MTLHRLASTAILGLLFRSNFINAFHHARLPSPVIKSLQSMRGERASMIKMNVASSTEMEEKTVIQEEEEKSMTQRIMEKTSSAGQTGGAGGSSTWEAFQKAELNWSRLKSSSSSTITPPTFITDDGVLGHAPSWDKLRSISTGEGSLDYDIVVCGGTLGIFIGMAMQLKGHRVCVVEGGVLRGREQEWNLSMDELMELVELGVLEEADLEEVVTTEFPGCRSGFKNKEVTPLSGGYPTNQIGYECVTPDVLNLGVSPSILIQKVATRFEASGGTIIQKSPIQGIIVSPSVGAAVHLSTRDGNEDDIITSRLILDCMGNASPISRQQRKGMKPDGVCCVVGSCASGYDVDNNLLGDIIYTNTEIRDLGKNGKLQYFWEAFPVGIKNKAGQTEETLTKSDIKTTYMFTYMDADSDRPSLTSLMNDYWTLLPQYQPSITNPETDLEFKRVLFAFFPTYRDSPLKPQFDRFLSVGDASGIQSPLSFGGFGALTRHLGRLSNGLDEALKGEDCLNKETLGDLNPYMPNLSAAWMFQKAMSVRMGANVDSKFVNRLLATNFQLMNDMGLDTIKPFLQDIIRIDGLVGSLSRAFVADPLFMPQIISHVGILTLADWMGHVSMIAWYTLLHAVATPVIKPFVAKLEDDQERFRWSRMMEAWEYGSGSDYILPSDKEASTS